MEGRLDVNDLGGSAQMTPELLLLLFFYLTTLIFIHKLYYRYKLIEMDRVCVILK